MLPRYAAFKTLLRDGPENRALHEGAGGIYRLS